MKRIAVILFLIFILAWINQTEKMKWVSFNWFNIPNPEELYLLEYPKTFSGNALQFDVYSSKNSVCSVYLCNKTLEKQLAEGRNRVELSTEDCGNDIRTTVLCGESFIRFYSNRTNVSFGDEHIDAKFGVTSYKRTARMNIAINSKLNDTAYKNFEILVDGKTALRPTYLLQIGEYNAYNTEELHLEPGTHTIELRYGDRTLDAKDVSITGQPFPFLDVVDVLLSLGIVSLVYRRCRLDWLTSSLSFFALSFSAIALQLQLQKNLGFSEWLLPLILALSLVLIWKSKKRQ
ncbi:MAG: hypothetical protein NT130_05365 [Candidatus Micrarchaeota archaeon]|nr:hypothetical protein [Candidatus Micrarchaeota archaeon]